MANKAVTLMRLCKTDSGWKRYKAVIGRNGRIRPGFAFVDGIPTEFPVGRYEVRYYDGSKPKYLPAGTNAQEATAAVTRQKNLLEAKSAVKHAGAKMVEPKGRAKLKDVLKKFVQDALDRGVNEAAEVNLHAGEEFLDIIKKTYVDEIVQSDFTKHQAALRKRDLSLRTIYNRYSRVCALLRFAKVDESVFPEQSPKYDKTLPEIYSQAQLTALFSSIRTTRKLVTYKLALQCGLREQELMHVEWTDFDWESQTLRVRSKPRYDFYVKDSEERDLPLSEDLIELLKKYQEESGDKSLLTGTKSGKPDTHILRALKRQVKQAGLACGSCDSCVQYGECEDWFLHKFRATYATTLLRNKVDIRTVQKLMGHSDIQTTMRYLRPAEDEELRSKVNAIAW